MIEVVEGVGAVGAVDVIDAVEAADAVGSGWTRIICRAKRGNGGKYSSILFFFFWWGSVTVWISFSLGEETVTAVWWRVLSPEWASSLWSSLKKGKHSSKGAIVAPYCVRSRPLLLS